MKPIVLIGGGMNHYQLIRSLEKEDLKHPIILVSSQRKVFDKKQLPHVLHQFIQYTDASYDLWKACLRKGIYFIEDQCIRINKEEKIIELEKNGKVEYERLSIECDSEPSKPLMKGALQDPVISVGGGLEFLKKVEAFIKEVKKHCPRDVRIAFSGDNLDALNLALAIKSRIQNSCEQIEIILFTAENHFFTDIPLLTKKALIKNLKTKGVRFLTGKTLEYVGDHQIYFTDNTQVEFDIFIPYENFRPVHVLSKILQSKSQQILVNPDLSYYKDHNMFVHGDCVALYQEAGNKNMIDPVEQVDVLKKNLLREDMDDPKVHYRQKQKRIKNVFLNKETSIKFLGPFSWETKKNNESWIKGLRENAFQLSEISTFDFVESQAELDLKYQSQHMSRPWKGSKNLFKEENTFKLISFNGFNWWGSYGSSAEVVTKMAILKAFAQGIKPQQLRFNLILPNQGGELVQHIFESTFRAIEAVAENYKINIGGGDTFNGDQWHLSMTVGGEVVRSFDKNFSQGDYVLMTQPLGFGVLWAGRFLKDFDSQWIETALDGTFLPSYERMQKFLDKWSPSHIGFVEEWGFLYHGLQALPVDQQLVVNFREIPRWRGVDEIFKQNLVHPGLDQNWHRIESEVAFSRDEVSKSNAILWDPLSQGSLLIGLTEENWEGALQDLIQLGFSQSALVGCLRRKQGLNKIVLSDWTVM